MRENIGLFKAQGINSVEWVTGLLTIMWGQYHIINPNDENTAYPIKTETLCEFTGLTDKHGNKIFENDIIKCAIEDPCTGKIDRFYNCYVKYCKTTNAMGWYGIDERKVLNKIPPQQDYVEIIGNKFDNKENK